MAAERVMKDDGFEGTQPGLDCCIGRLVEDTVFKEFVILSRPCLLHWALYIGLEKPVCY